MKDKASPEAAVHALQSTTGALYRHGPNGSREFLSLATRLENGIWAGVQDRGIFPGKVYGKFCGTEVVVDLYLHIVTAEGGVEILPIYWAMRTPFAPIALLGIPGDTGQGLDVAPTGEMTWPQYQHIHRPAIAGTERFDGYKPRGEISFDVPVSAVPGSIYEQPMTQSYRKNGDDNSHLKAVCISADMDYPSDTILGGPVVDDFGRLVGIVIGADQGLERGHVGMYMPADFLPPVIALAKSNLEASRRRDRSWTGVEFVQFWNSEVEWAEDLDFSQRPTHIGDQPIKVILPRATWGKIFNLAREGLETEYGRDESYGRALGDLSQIIRH